MISAFNKDTLISCHCQIPRQNTILIHPLLFPRIKRAIILRPTLLSCWETHDSPATLLQKETWATYFPLFPLSFLLLLAFHIGFFHKTKTIPFLHFQQFPHLLNPIFFFHCKDKPSNNPSYVYLFAHLFIPQLAPICFLPPYSIETNFTKITNDLSGTKSSKCYPSTLTLSEFWAGLGSCAYSSSKSNPLPFISLESPTSLDILPSSYQFVISLYLLFKWSSWPTHFKFSWGNDAQICTSSLAILSDFQTQMTTHSMRCRQWKFMMFQTTFINSQTLHHQQISPVPVFPVSESIPPCAQART